jgi:ribonuclease-3
MLNKNHDKLQNIIEYEFNNLEVLVVALTHKSYLSDFGTQSCNNNERMEFLGDSILSMVVAEALYIRYSLESEGKLSQLKAQIISATNLSAWAKKIDLGNYVFLGKSGNTIEARQRESLLCDVFEALVGAIYLDGGFENVKKFILKFLDHQKEVLITDYKSRLQEIVQSVYKDIPEYKILKEFGPDHSKRFKAVVYINNKLFGAGVGSSKKEAHQSAAKKAIKNINQIVDTDDV